MLNDLYWGFFRLSWHQSEPLESISLNSSSHSAFLLTSVLSPMNKEQDGRNQWPSNGSTSCQCGLITCQKVWRVCRVISVSRTGISFDHKYNIYLIYDHWVNETLYNFISPIILNNKNQERESEFIKSF